MPHTTWPIPEEMLLGQYIPLHYHFNMLRDAMRMDAFREAIDRIVPPGGKVLELGGGTGVLSWFAAQHAERVWCVERNPALVRAARSFLANNIRGDRVEVVQADALDYLPPEPVDVVICEMLHIALICEKQTDVIRSFKKRYAEKFGPRLPAFIPDASLLAVQLVEQDFCFSGFHAPVPVVEAGGPNRQHQLLSDPQIYSTVYYEQAIPTQFQWEGSLEIQRNGVLNAISFLTKHFLAFLLTENRAVQWMMNQLVLPLPNPMEVYAGDVASVRISYTAGCPMESLAESFEVDLHAQSIPMRRAS